MKAFPSAKHFRIEGHATADSKQPNFSHDNESTSNRCPSELLDIELKTGCCKNPPSLENFRVLASSAKLPGKVSLNATPSLSTLHRTKKKLCKVWNLHTTDSS